MECHCCCFDLKCPSCKTLEEGKQLDQLTPEVAQRFEWLREKHDLPAVALHISTKNWKKDEKARRMNYEECLAAM